MCVIFSILYYFTSLTRGWQEFVIVIYYSTSLRYLKAFGTSQLKGSWPYEYMTGTARLEDTRPPPREAFHSTLRGEDISVADYAQFVEVSGDDL